MGFSVSSSTLIIMLGLLVSAGMAYGIMDNGIDQIHTAQEDSVERQIDMKNTDIVITNTTYNSSDDTFTVSLKNTGSQTLDVKKTDLLLDGEYIPKSQYSTTVDQDSNQNLWVSGSVLNMTVTGVTSKPGRVKVVTENEIAVAQEVN